VASSTRSKWRRVRRATTVNTITISSDTLAPAVNLVMPAMRNTVTDIVHPSTPIRLLVRERAPRTRQQWTTIPAWESVKARNTPTA